MREFKPRLDILPKGQRRLWQELSAVPDEFTFALVAAERLYGSSFNPEITLKALSYFDDGNLRELPADMKFRLANAVRNVNLDHLPSLDDFTLRSEREHGVNP